MKESRLHYIKNVLGIRTLMVPETLQAKNEDVEFLLQIDNGGDILFLSGFNDDQSSAFTIEEIQLFEKIIVALKLNFQKVDIAKFLRPAAESLLVSSLSKKNYNYVFIFGDPKKSLLHSEKEFGSLRLFYTFGADEMLKNPDLKKDAWQGFKGIMENLPR